MTEIEINNTENAKNASASKPAPLSEVLEIMLTGFRKLLSKLEQDNSEERIAYVIDHAYAYNIDYRMSEEIQTILRKLHLPDQEYNHTELCGLLYSLVTALEVALAEEQHKEFSRFVRRILVCMVKHSDEVARWIEESI